MPIVEQVTARTQAGTGAFKPKSDARTHRVHWGVVDGQNHGAYMPLGDLTSTGVAIGREGRSHLVYEEYRGKDGRPNDIKYGGLTLRECVVPIAEAQDKERREARESTEECRDFLDANDLRQRVGEGGLLNMRADLQIDIATAPERQTDPPISGPAPKIQVGWTPERRAAQGARLAAARAAKAAKAA
jgi:hypothetical protein